MFQIEVELQKQRHIVHERCREMLDKPTMMQALKIDHCRVTFNKQNGDQRIMTCTLRAKDVVPHEKKTDRVKKPNDQVVPVWDINAAAWRSFRVDSVTNFEMLHV